MYLRKTTTAPARGRDVLSPLYQQVADSHAKYSALDILQVGAGVGVKALRNTTNSSKLMRRLDSFIRSLPLPESCFTSYEPLELYNAISGMGFATRLRVADINPNVLSIARREFRTQQMAFELLDLSEIPRAFLHQSFDICIALNVLPHLRCTELKTQAATNLIALTREGGYIAGVLHRDMLGLEVGVDYKLERVGPALYRKYTRHADFTAQRLATQSSLVSSNSATVNRAAGRLIGKAR